MLGAFFHRQSARATHACLPSCRLQSWSFEPLLTADVAQRLAQGLRVGTALALAIAILGVEPNPKAMPTSGRKPDIWRDETEPDARAPASRRARQNPVARG